MPLHQIALHRPGPEQNPMSHGPHRVSGVGCRVSGVGRRVSGVGRRMSDVPLDVEPHKEGRSPNRPAHEMTMNSGHLPPSSLHGLGRAAPLGGASHSLNDDPSLGAARTHRPTDPSPYRRIAIPPSHLASIVSSSASRSIPPRIAPSSLSPIDDLANFTLDPRAGGKR
jgi:hypothetical protein